MLSSGSGRDFAVGLWARVSLLPSTVLRRALSTSSKGCRALELKASRPGCRLRSFGSRLNHMATHARVVATSVLLFVLAVDMPAQSPATRGTPPSMVEGQQTPPPPAPTQQADQPPAQPPPPPGQRPPVIRTEIGR